MRDRVSLLKLEHSKRLDLTCIAKLIKSFSETMAERTLLRISKEINLNLNSKIKTKTSKIIPFNSKEFVHCCTESFNSKSIALNKFFT